MRRHSQRREDALKKTFLRCICLSHLCEASLIHEKPCRHLSISHNLETNGGNVLALLRQVNASQNVDEEPQNHNQRLSLGASISDFLALNRGNDTCLEKESNQ